MSPGALVKFHVLVQDSFVSLGVHLKKYYKKIFETRNDQIGVHLKKILQKIFETWSDQISYQEMA